MKASPYQLALQLLRKATITNGFLASAQPRDNYGRIWTRDGVICGLAALASGEPDLIFVFKSTLETIFQFQHQAGYFPSNCIPLNKSVSYGGAVGRVDNPSWAIIGLCSYLLKEKDTEMKNRLKPNVVRGFAVLEAWEFNGKHLIYVPMSGDWADEYVHHGYILFDQLLRIWALELAAKVYEEPDWQDKANLIRSVIEANFHKNLLVQKAYLPLLNREKENYPKEFWLMGFNPGELYTQFDLQANALALYLNVGSDETRGLVLNYIFQWNTSNQRLIPSLYPRIGENDPRMSLLSENYAYGFRNHPNQFHNGGLWPVWNGFFLACIRGHMSSLEKGWKTKIESACSLGSSKGSTWEFNECLDGITGEPNGLPQCSWSAAGLILAEKGFYEN
ncbi:MAG: fructofuranosidase/invertase [Bacteroidia bacterium]|nr:fructofuranosidase/invertase [Bacteroidia bacterium]MCF8426559.1 fructofuranosidase/invertase [Bacteroidia bacterium]